MNLSTIVLADSTRWVLARAAQLRQTAAVARLLVVHHTSSPAVHTMVEQVRAGTCAEGVEGVEVVLRPALSASVSDVLSADGYLLGTPANIGYMSGALKHFFDQIYYPCLEATRRRPYGCFIHGNSDTTGALRSIETIVTGLGWRRAQQPVVVVGPPSKSDLEACFELGAALAAELAMHSA